MNKFALHAAPVDRAAARVISKGVQYQPAARMDCDSDLPLPIIKLTVKNTNFVDLTGQRVGRLLVLGISAASLGSRWVCRCDCGHYTIRTARAIKSAENAQDRCSHCKHLAFLKRSEHWRLYKKDVDIKKL